MKYKKLISKENYKKVLKHVSNTLAVSNKRPADEITNALLSWDRADEHYKNLITNLGDIKGKKLLDVGSGYGLFLTISLINGAKSIGLEPAKNKSYVLTNYISREILKKAGFSSRLIHGGFGEKMPFADNSFDIVTSFYTLEHVKDVKKVFKETVRVLKPGGYIFFEAPNYGSVWEGHYGILWIPFLPKLFAKQYVKLWGKNPKLLDEIVTINVPMIKKICRDLPIEIISTGKSDFERKINNMEFTKVGTLTSAVKIINFLKNTRVLYLLIVIAKLFQAQTPIIFVARKNV